MANTKVDKSVKPQISKSEKERLTRLEETKKAEVAAKKKKKAMLITTIGSIALVVVLIIVLATVLPGIIAPSNVVGTYTLDTQKVVLKEDKTFTATLAHDETKSGTYTVEGRTIIFVSSGVTTKGTISSKNLNIPTEWEDDHGHGGTFKKS